LLLDPALLALSLDRPLVVLGSVLPYASHILLDWPLLQMTWLA
jgi:hypothetical protein